MAGIEGQLLPTLVAGRSKSAVLEALAAEGAASERQIRLALSYYEHFVEEIDAAIAENRRTVEQLRDDHPWITVSSAPA
jgi:hypothetical protein